MQNYRRIYWGIIAVFAFLSSCKKEIRSQPEDSGFIVYGDPFNTNISSVVPLQDGGFLIVGQRSVGGYFNQNSKDGWLVRTDERGNVKWTRTYGGPRMDWLFSGVELKDGNLMVCGLTASQGTALSTPGSQIGDGWVLKIKENGDIIWSKSVPGGSTGGQLNGIYEDMFLHVSPTDYGTFLLSGQSASFKDTGKAVPPGISSAAWLVELDDTGKLLWEIGHKTTMNNDAESFNKVWRRQGRIITGHNGAAYGVGDPYIGFIAWKPAPQGQKPEMDYSGYHVQTGVNTIINDAHWMFPEESGEIFITGFEPDRPDSLYLLKFDGSGNKLFYKFLSVPGIVSFRGSWRVEDGFYIVGTYQKSYADPSDPVVLFANKEGIVQWYRIVEQNSSAEAVFVIPDNNGNLSVFGNLVDATNGTHDGFLLRLNKQGEVIK